MFIPKYNVVDKKINIVAAPGSGKTVLGLELARRLGEPVLILSPTVTIKNQWKQRILDNFLPSDFNPDLISTDIKNLSEITISTYQGLHSLYKNIEDRENFIKQLKRLNVNTLVLDEAHHLRTEWWATLNSLYEEMNNKKLKKSLDFCNKENIPYVIILGEDEITNNSFKLKDMINKDEVLININELDKVKEIIRKDI